LICCKKTIQEVVEAIKLEPEEEVIEATNNDDDSISNDNDDEGDSEL
jgi:hypothetical protein